MTSPAAEIAEHCLQERPRRQRLARRRVYIPPRSTLTQAVRLSGKKILSSECERAGQPGEMSPRARTRGLASARPERTEDHATAGLVDGHTEQKATEALEPLSRTDTLGPAFGAVPVFARRHGLPFIFAGRRSSRRRARPSNNITGGDKRGTAPPWYEMGPRDGDPGAVGHLRDTLERDGLDSSSGWSRLGRKTGAVGSRATLLHLEDRARHPPPSRGQSSR